MNGTLVYLHGTGEQNHSENERKVKEMLEDEPALRDFAVRNIAWSELCPPRAKLKPLLPKDQRETESDDDQHPVEGFAQDLAAEYRAVQTEGLAMEIFTSVLISRRLGLSQVMVDFLQYVVYYFRVSDGVEVMTGIRDRVAQEIAAADQSHPVVVLGHSLGGIIAVDVASDPSRRGRIDLTVTVGSQMPLLFALGAVPEFAPDGRHPVAPWLNIYNPRDPLAFLAAEVFAWADPPPIDVEVTDPRNLIGSHTGYPTNPKVYREIADRLRGTPNMDGS